MFLCFIFEAQMCVLRMATMFCVPGTEHNTFTSLALLFLSYYMPCVIFLVPDIFLNFSVYIFCWMHLIIFIFCRVCDLGMVVEITMYNLNTKGSVKNITSSSEI